MQSRSTSYSWTLISLEIKRTRVRKKGMAGSSSKSFTDLTTRDSEYASSSFPARIC